MRRPRLKRITEREFWSLVAYLQLLVIWAYCFWHWWFPTLCVSTALTFLGLWGDERGKK